MLINKLEQLSLFHPVKILCLDDNINFLDTLEIYFSENLNIEKTTDPYKALKILEDNKKVTLYQNNNEINQFPYLDIIYDKNRFNSIPIVVVDFEMPEMNGIEFCSRIKDQNIFKIMLTAEADKDTAIEAFNMGLIDKFILKTNKNLFVELENNLLELITKYFTNLARDLNSLAEKKSPLSNMGEYKKIFKSLLQKINAIEYYKFDSSGSYLFLDANKNPTWFIVRTTEMINEQFDLLKGYDFQSIIYEQIEKKEMMLCLLSEIEYKKPHQEWLKYLFKTDCLNTDTYYSIIQKNLTDSINWSKI